MIKRSLCLLLFGTLLNLYAEDADPDMKALETFKNILQVDIDVSLLQQDKKIAWNTKESKYTIPGKAVKVTIQGNNIKMIGSFTPYFDSEGNLILLAQGQIFMQNATGKGFMYYTYFNSIRTQLGETIVFFPLGFSENKPDDSTNIEIDIQVQSFNPQLKENDK